MNEDLKKWDDEAENWSVTIRPKRVFVSSLVLPEFDKLLGDLKDKRILDAGCGEGSVSEHLKRQGAEVVGVDGSPKMIEFAKSRYPDISFGISDLLEKLPFENNSFDFVLSSFVLMSLEQIDIFLSESKRILKSGGFLVVGVFHPAFNTPTMKLYRSWLGKILRKPVMGLAYSYFHKTTSRKDAQGKKPWPFYHRTLEEYIRNFRKYELEIDAITEPHELPKDIVEKNRLDYATRLPRFIFFKLRKA